MATMIVETGSASATANSYCSVANADTYHEMRLHATDWTEATDSDKEKALMWATRLLDEQVQWNGYKYTTTQALAWPRSSVSTIDGDDFLYTEIPDFLKNATAEFARCLIVEDRTADPVTKGFKQIIVGDGEVDITIDKHDRAKTIPPSVWTIIRPYCSKIKNPIKTLVLQ